MDKEKLSSYFWLSHEIKKQERRKERLKKKINSGGLTTDTVRGSSAHFPYLETKFAITGVPVGMLEAIEEDIKKSIQEAIKMRCQIESFIDQVDDPQLRELLRSRFIDCLRWSDVGKENYISADHARKKIREYLSTLK